MRETVETKEITVKLLRKIIKHTFRNNLQQSNMISFHHEISIISMASKMAEAD